MRSAATLHATLFPIGPRQLSALPDGASSFLAQHRGIARALADLVADADPAVRDWLLLRGEGVASELLWDRSPLRSVTEAARRRFHEARLAADGDLGQAYIATLPPDLRHRLGEHYTPPWLVDRVVGAFAPSLATVADPACGDGRFLVALLRAGHASAWGADLNPLAVVMARINVWTAEGRPSRRPATDVVWGDFILAASARPVPPGLAGAAANARAMPVATGFVGNPPWVTWRNLSGPYRDAVAAHLATSRLHHARGWNARVSAGQVDLAHVFVHQAVESVAGGGRVAFVLPRTLFKAPVGPGRVREGVSTSGRAYRFDEVWACEEPFAGVRVDTVVAFVTADAPHSFPVAWRTVSPEGAGPAGPAVLSDPDDVSSPWLTAGAGPLRIADGERWTGLRGRGGVNTGGGNGVFYVDVVGERGDNLVVRGAPARRGTTVAVTREVERRFVRPLLRGRDVRAWSATPSGHLILPHDPEDLRKPVPEKDLAMLAPLTLAYLREFRDVLAGRKELERWNSPSWFTLFRIGPYTAGGWRVVWPHSANGRLRAALLAPDDPAVPDQKVVLVAFEERAPALFLTALLNAPAVGAAASASAGMDASPNLVRRLALPRFVPERGDHQRIVSLAAAACGGDAVSAAECGAAVDRLFA